MRRRPPSAAMSLFSYLDGLVCTMGALILLLLLTTHRIREQVLAEHQNQIASSVAATPLPPVPVVSVPVRPVGPTDAELEARRRLIAEKLAERRREEERHQAEKLARHEEWQQKLRSIDQLTEKLASDVTASRRRVSTAHATAEEVAGEMVRLTGQVSATRQQTGQLKQTEEELKRQAEDLLRLREESLKTIEAAKVQQALRNPVFEVVTEETHSGTTRRPILIECTADSLIFCSEGIRLSAATLNEFTPEYNPLLAGTEALMSYWKQADQRQSSPPTEPYVLMIVRPGGTVGFYVARRFLEKLGQDFGYELVSATAEFQWPPADPMAVQVCRKAIDDVLAGVRPQSLTPGSRFGINGGAGGGTTRPGRGTGSGMRPDTEQIVGNNGEFSLAEIDQLRNARARDAIDMLGPEWRQSRRSQPGSPAGRQDDSATGSENGSGTLSAIESEMRSGQGADPGERPPVSGTNASDTNFSLAPQGNRQPLVNEEWSRRGSTSGQKPSVDSSSSSTVPGETAGTDRQGMPLSPLGGSPQRSPGANSFSSSARPGERQMPPPPLTAMPETSTKWKNDGGAQRKWGRGQTNGAIGIERTIVLHMKSDRFEIEEGPQMGIPHETTRAEFQDAVAAMIEFHAQSWGTPPSNYFWRPTFQIHIHPGGHIHYLQLKELLEYWALSYKIEHVSQ